MLLLWRCRVRGIMDWMLWFLGGRNLCFRGGEKIGIFFRALISSTFIKAFESNMSMACYIREESSLIQTNSASSSPFSSSTSRTKEYE